jgi:hypothetical protein
MPRYRTVGGYPNPDPYAEARALFEAAKRANDRDSADRLSRMALCPRNKIGIIGASFKSHRSATLRTKPVAFRVHGEGIPFC